MREKIFQNCALFTKAFVSFIPSFNCREVGHFQTHTIYEFHHSLFTGKSAIKIETRETSNKEPFHNITYKKCVIETLINLSACWKNQPKIVKSMASKYKCSVM